MEKKVLDFDAHRRRKEGLQRVRLIEDLEPEFVLDGWESGIVYHQGWKGTVFGEEGTGNHKDHFPVLFDDYQPPVWIHKKYLEFV